MGTENTEFPLKWYSFGGILTILNQAKYTLCQDIFPKLLCCELLFSLMPAELVMSAVWYLLLMEMLILTEQFECGG